MRAESAGQGPGDPFSSGGHAGTDPDRQAAGVDPHEHSPRVERIGESAEEFVDSVESAITSAMPQKIRSRRDPRQNTVVNAIWRALVLLAGIGLILVGIALLVLPGPGWGMILLGLVVLASEYTWANRLVEPVRSRVKAEAQRVNRLPPGRRFAVYAATVITSATFIAIGVWFMARGNWSWPPW